MLLHLGYYRLKWPSYYNLPGRLIDPSTEAVYSGNLAANGFSRAQFLFLRLDLLYLLKLAEFLTILASNASDSLGFFPLPVAHVIEI